MSGFMIGLAWGCVFVLFTEDTGKASAPLSKLAFVLPLMLGAFGYLLQDMA